MSSNVQAFVGAKVTLTSEQRRTIAQAARIESSETGSETSKAGQEGPGLQPKRFALAKKITLKANLFAAQASDPYAPNESDFVGYPPSESSLSVGPPKDHATESKGFGLDFYRPVTKTYHHAQAPDFHELVKASEKQIEENERFYPQHPENHHDGEVDHLRLQKRSDSRSENPQSNALVERPLIHRSPHGSGEQDDYTHQHRSRSAGAPKNPSQKHSSLLQRSVSEGLESVDATSPRGKGDLLDVDERDEESLHQTAQSEEIQSSPVDAVGITGNRFLNRVRHAQPEGPHFTQSFHQSSPNGQALESDDTRLLDYSHDQLLDMSFEDLAKQPFHHDPRAQPPIEQAFLDRPLNEQLSHVMQQSTTIQQDFLQSLSKEKWEEARDWFTSQFTEVASKMTEARRAKRKIAQDFEDEIQQRQQMGRNKDSAIDNAISQIRSGGSKLLDPHRTPRN
ncbi:MAG: hypothetical protein M1814_001636 [Vezdaea aestivalis]|nr:MAG: hypothetical protein M1814_001636 [Vezdaea aestivalis]